MRVRLRTKSAVAAGVMVGCLCILLGALIVMWIDDHSSPSCPGESATTFVIGSDESWCTPKEEFCELLRKGAEEDEAAFRETCAEFLHADD